MVRVMARKKAIIAGAGIGGLCSALALLEIGWDVSVYDKTAYTRDDGAGIVLAANAMNILDRLGVAEQVRVEGARVGVAEIRTDRGKLLKSLPVGEQAELYGTYSYVIHRGDLLWILLDRVRQQIPVAVNKPWVSYEKAADRIVAVFEDGSREEGDLLIGADGVHTVVRERLFGPVEMRYSGYTAFRGVCTHDGSCDPTLPGSGFEAWGAGQRFGFSLIGKGRAFWFAAINAPQGRVILPEERKEAMRQAFHGWYPPVLSAIEATPELTILQHDIADARPLQSWSKDRVILLGDSAHPMLPNLGQGGAQAMEDAIVLSTCLSRYDIPEALIHYEKLRQGRTSGIARLSRWMGRIAQLDNPLLVRMRNLAIRSMPDRIYLKRFDSIVGWKEEAFH
jgi:2-polyprenyl-6-methoxyphenol hydroxylase-like FAD-dependent oxidoreductase